jgi:hypothetical protein
MNGMVAFVNGDVGTAASRKCALYVRATLLRITSGPFGVSRERDLKSPELLVLLLPLRKSLLCSFKTFRPRRLWLARILMCCLNDLRVRADKVGRQLSDLKEREGGSERTRTRVSRPSR